jgi:glycosyltransferase involved in cell wall biosynthesis
MNWRTECAVVIPCADEAAAIYSVVESARRFLPEVIVVDDGSSDTTGDLAVKAGAEVIRRASRQGKGAAIIMGCQRAGQRGFQWVLTMDGDRQHAAEDIPAFLEAAADGKADMVVGNRFAGANQMPWVRRRVNLWMSRRLSRAAGVVLPDSQCGFRLIKLSAWSALEVKTRHFEIESEMLLGFAARGFTIRFVPVQSIYGTERSKIHPLRDTWRWFRWWRSARRARKPADAGK